MINPMELTGKHILIAGASSGIGYATAVLASQLGAKLSLLARRENKLNEILPQLEGVGHRAYIFDLAQLDRIEEMINAIVSENGTLDGFVYCAGISPVRPIKITKSDFMKSVFEINLFPYVELIKSIVKRKNCNDNASIIGISSVAAFKPNKTQTAYAASKAAINGVTKVIAKEVADRRIRVNAVAFGMIYTKLYEDFLAAGGDESLLSDQYLGIGDQRDAANVLCFLLSEASKFITGTCLVADGGFLS
jgi:NAD(P)-dependent dehydrogenase (short-subunit alcohol dehydrogenase family)